MVAALAASAAGAPPAATITVTLAIDQIGRQLPVVDRIRLPPSGYSIATLRPST